jgi:hypothetical protein
VLTATGSPLRCTATDGVRLRRWRPIPLATCYIHTAGYGAAVEWQWHEKTEQPGTNPSLRGDRPATNHLSHGTASDPTTGHWKQKRMRLGVIGSACSTHRKYDKCIQTFWYKNLKEEYEPVNFDVDGILKAVRWVTLAQDRDRRPALVNTAMNVRFHKPRRTRLAERLQNTAQQQTGAVTTDVRRVRFSLIARRREHVLRGGRTVIVKWNALIMRTALKWIGTVFTGRH